MADDEVRSRLRQCPDCEGLVSVRAATCPHCGAPQDAVAGPAPEPALTSEPALTYEQQVAIEQGAERADVTVAGWGAERRRRGVHGAGEGIFMRGLNLVTVLVLAVFGLLVVLVVLGALGR